MLRRQDDRVHIVPAIHGACVGGLGLPDSASKIAAVGFDKLLPPSHHGQVLILSSINLFKLSNHKLCIDDQSSPTYGSI